MMEVPSDYSKCRCKYFYLYLKAKYQKSMICSKSSRHIAELSARSITPSTKIVKRTESSAATKVEESVTTFLSCYCAIANFRNSNVN